MADVHILAINLARRSFQVCATDGGGAVIFNRTVSRAKLIQMLDAHEACIVTMEACATSHYWGASRRATATLKLNTFLIHLFKYTNPGHPVQGRPDYS